MTAIPEMPMLTDARSSLLKWLMRTRAAASASPSVQPHVHGRAHAEPDLFCIEDDWASEAINFRFMSGGIARRGIITYEVLQKCNPGDGRTEPEMAHFLRRTEAIRRAAIGRASHSSLDAVVILDDLDL
jgi:hypothetical protein